MRNNGHPIISMIDRMANQPPSNVTVIENISALKLMHGWSNRTLAKKSGVSDRMIGKILNGESEPTTTTIDKIANAFEIESWHLMIPNFRPELFSKNRFQRVLHAYTDTDNDGRKVMETQADYIAKKEPSNDTDIEHKKNTGT